MCKNSEIERNDEQPLLERLEAYGRTDVYPFHMPGHKRRLGPKEMGHLYEMDITEIDGFDNRVKSQYQSVVRQMDTFVDNFLHTKSDERMRWLIQAILTLLSEDHSVTDGTLFYLSESPISKKELLALDQYCLSSLLLAVWHYIVVNRPDNEKGRATFEQFHERADEVGARWKFISPIGKTYPRQITFDLFSVKSEKMHRGALSNHSW